MCGVCRQRSQCVQSALLSDLAEQTAAEPAHAAEHGQVGAAPWCLGITLCEGPVTCLQGHTAALQCTREQLKAAAVTGGARQACTAAPPPGAGYPDDSAWRSEVRPPPAQRLLVAELGRVFPFTVQRVSRHAVTAGPTRPTLLQAGARDTPGQPPRWPPAGLQGGHGPAARFGAPGPTPGAEPESLLERVARTAHEFDANETKEALLELAKGCARAPGLGSGLARALLSNMRCRARSSGCMCRRVPRVRAASSWRGGPCDAHAASPAPCPDRRAPRQVLPGARVRVRMP
jgi:hypothetical protein